MNSLIKIDDRLLHGQIIYSWTRYLGINRIIVANDDVVKNDLKLISLRMAIPRDIKCDILCVNDAIKILKEGICENLKALVVVDNARDTIRIIENINNIQSVNVSTYGRNSVNTEEKREVVNNMFLTEDDICNFKYLINLGIKIEYRNVPSEDPQDFGSIINKL